MSEDQPSEVEVLKRVVATKPVDSDTPKEQEGNGHDIPPQPIHNGFHFHIHNKLIFILLQVH